MPAHVLRTLSIIIPAYNEGRTITELLDQVLAVKLREGVLRELVIVVDGSKDDTAERAKAFQAAHPEERIRVFEQPENRGKGAAIHKGIELAEGDHLIVQDADLELAPEQINDLLDPVLAGEADVVYGDRFAEGLPYPEYPVRSYRANRFLTWLSNRFTGLTIGDMEVCYKLIPVPVAKKLVLKEQRFGFEPEVTSRLARVKGLRWKQVPVRYSARTRGEGKKIGWKDGVRAVWCIMRYR
jgi:glycosyltransferase involved in cell wall biosynthesis